MRTFPGTALVVLALTAAMSGQAVGRVRVSAQVDSTREIYLGESFGYYITIEGSDKPGQVDLNPLENYSPQSTGNREQSSISIINGRVTKNVTTVMTYSLTAPRAGLVRLPPVTVTVEGGTYQTNPVQVNVLRPGTTDKLELEVTLSEERCYVGQPVEIIVKFYSSASDIRNPQFNVPVLYSDAFYLANPDVLDRGEQEYDLGGGATVLVSQQRTVHKGKGCNLIVLRKVLIPKTAGEIRIEPATVSADVAVRQRRSFWGPQFEYQRFMAGSKPLALTVLPLPEQGKPPGFYGLVGRYTISVSAKPTKVYMGDPITLTIKIGAGKYLKPVRWPALEQVPELAANFKIPSQKSAPTIENGFKVFTQTIRPDNNQAAVIPSIPLTFFDPDKGEYVVAKSEPVRLDLTASKRLTDADLEGRDFSPANKEVEAIKKGLSANYEGLDVLVNQTFSPLAAMVSPVYAALWAVPLAGLILSLLIKRLTYTSPERTALKRRRQAFRRAVGGLKQVTCGEPSQRHELLVSVMKQYVGERFDRMAGSLTADDCREVIVAAIRDGQTAEKYRDTIAECEAMRYASVEANIDGGKVKEVIEIIRAIEKKAGK